MGKIIASQDHILSRCRYRRTIFRSKYIIHGKHKKSRFCLSFHRKRNMHSHLVTVKVSIKRSACKRMKLYSLTFYQYRLKRLYTKPMQSWRTVQHYRMLLNNTFQHIPNLRSYFFHHSFGTLNVVSIAVLHQLFHNKRLEQFQSHLLREATLVKLKLRAYYDYRSSGIVYPLAQQILSESSLFTFEHIRKRFKRSGSRTRNGSASSSIIYKSINGFLKHSLFISYNDIGCTKFKKSVKPVISVYYTSVQIIQIGSCESSSVQLNHRSKIRRNNRNNFQYHPFRSIARQSESFNNLQSSYNPYLLLACSADKLVSQIL